MENRKNTERKTVIKNQKNDGCFLTSSLRKPPTSTHTKQNCKNQQTLDTTTKIEASKSHFASLFESLFRTTCTEFSGLLMQLQLHHQNEKFQNVYLLPIGHMKF